MKPDTSRWIINMNVGEPSQNRLAVLIDANNALPSITGGLLSPLIFNVKRKKMESTTEFEFNFDEQYEKEKGVFTVLSIHKNEMEIQWKNGEKTRTEIDLQRRIQERRQREKTAREAKNNEAKSQSRKSAALKMRSEFEGLQPSDFKNTAAKTTWRGRNQLGGAVTKQLPKDNFAFKFVGTCPKARNPLD
jgi:hypothetical protein